MGFVITAIDHSHPIDLQPIAERERWMIQVLGGNLDVVDLEGALDQVVIANPGAALIERDREVGILHLPGKGLTQGLAEAVRAVDVPFVAGHEQRREERDALDVIPVRMADQDMAARALSAGRDQLLTERVSPSSAIQDYKGVSRRSHLDAWGVSSVTSGARAGLGDRTASPQNWMRTQPPLRTTAWQFP